MPKSRSDSTPFRLTITLAVPVSLNHPWLHLDSLIRHLVDDRTYGADADLTWDDETRGDRRQAMRRAGTDKYMQVLDRQMISGDWIGCGSISHFWPPAEGESFDGVEHDDAISYETLRYFKRFEAGHFPGRGKVTLSNGHYRTWMLQTVYLPAHTATFYGRGKIGQVRDLLGDLTHLGNDARIGWGEIHDWTLDPTPEDWSLVRDGVAQRPIPTRMLQRWDDEAWLTWHAPYWDRSKVEPCAPPGARVTLK